MYRGAQNEKDAVAKGQVTQETVNRRIVELEKAKKYYGAVADIANLPLADFERRAYEIEEKMKKDSPAAALVMPAFGKFREQEAGAEALLAVLKAAIAIVLDGPDRAKDFKDPFGDGPFEYVPVGNGFVLKSKLVVNDKPVAVTVPGAT